MQYGSACGNREILKRELVLIRNRGEVNLRWSDDLRKAAGYRCITEKELWKQG